MLHTLFWMGLCFVSLLCQHINIINCKLISKLQKSKSDRSKVLVVSLSVSPFMVKLQSSSCQCTQDLLNMAYNTLCLFGIQPKFILSHPLSATLRPHLTPFLCISSTRDLLYMCMDGRVACVWAYCAAHQEFFQISYMYKVTHNILHPFQCISPQQS